MISTFDRSSTVSGILFSLLKQLSDLGEVLDDCVDDSSEQNGKRSFLRLVIGRIFVFIPYVERLLPAISDGAFRLHVSLAEDNRSDFFHCLKGKLYHSWDVCFICFQDDLIMQ